MHALDLILRTAAGLQLAWLAGLILGIRRADHVPMLGAAFCAAVVAFVVTSVPGFSPPALLLVPLTALCVIKAVLFWLFATGLFSDAFRVRRRHLALLGVTAAVGVWQQCIYVARAHAGLAGPAETLGSLAFEASILVFVLWAVARALRGLPTDLVEPRRRLRMLFVLGTAGYLVAVVAIQVSNLAGGTSTAAPLVRANLALIFGLAALATRSLVRVRQRTFIDAAPRLTSTEARTLSSAEAAVLQGLRRAMEGDKVYRREGLTVASLAAQLRTREHVLRRVINRGLGFRNFNDFLHTHRIQEATERLRATGPDAPAVLTVALEVGYASIGPFNRAFKERLGMTPTDFRRTAGGEDAGRIRNR